MPDILSPQEVAERKARSAQPASQSNTVTKTPIPSFGAIAENNASKVKLDYETMGRFSIPESLYFEDWDTEDINNLTLCNEDNILETLTNILNKNIKNQDFKIEDMLFEEFLETMIGIKSSFDSPIHIHKWVCNCQKELEDKEKTIHDYTIDLRTLNYVSVLEADEKLREYYKKIFESMTREQFAEFIIAKYGNGVVDSVNEFTVEKELAQMKIQEPMKQNINGKMYEFRFMRIGDLLLAQKEADKKYQYNAKVLNSKKYRKELGELSLFKSNQEEQLKQLQEEKAKEVLLYSQASTIMSIDGKAIISLQEKIKAFKEIKRQARFNFLAFLDIIKFGISTEMNLVCPLCGKEEKSFFRREVSPLEFIPFSDDTNDKLRNAPTGYIFM